MNNKSKFIKQTPKPKLVKVQQAQVPVTDNEIKYECVKLVTYLEMVQDSLDFIEGTTLYKNNLKNAVKALKNVVEQTLKQWYSVNLPSETGQVAYFQAGKDFANAIKAVGKLSFGMWQFIPEMLQKPKDLTEAQKASIKERIALFLVGNSEFDRRGVSEKYLMNLLYDAIEGYLANTPKPKDEVLRLVFTHYAYTLHDVQPDEAMISKFVGMFHDFGV